MTTLAEAIDASLDANWSGAGGTEPTISNTQDVIGEYFPATDYILILGYTLRTTMRAVNDVYAHKIHTIDLECSTSDATNTEDRLNEIIEEAERILQTDAAVTGYDAVRIIRVDRSITPRDRHVYKALVTVELQEYLAESATASGAGTTYTLGQALMLGSANAAWVPCIPYWSSGGGHYVASSGSEMFSNVGADDVNLMLILPLPTVKGTLKLYVTGVRVTIKDADAGDYVSSLILLGLKEAGNTNIITENTDRTAAGTYTTTVAATDMSSYNMVCVYSSWVCTNANDLDVTAIEVDCYYAI